MKLYYLKSELPKTEFAPNYRYVILENNIEVDNLKELILDREREVSDGFDITYSRFKYFDKNFWKKPEIEKLENSIKENILIYLKSLHITIPENLFIQAWINVMRNKQMIEIHQHDCSPHSFISGNICIDSLDTQTHYVDPISFHHTDKKIFSSDNTPGKITLFPSVLPHYTDQYLENDVRITVAFDIFVKDHNTIVEKMGKVNYFDDNIKEFKLK